MDEGYNPVTDITADYGYWSIGTPGFLTGVYMSYA
jgi:hypothetical protein